jgi:hypothetical protein
MQRHNGMDFTKFAKSVEESAKMGGGGGRTKQVIVCFEVIIPALLNILVFRDITSLRLANSRQGVTPRKVK